MITPSFSIVTPVLNGDKTISRTIESVLNQTFPALEYFIIDGESSDKTIEIAKQYEDLFEQKGIKYVICSEQDGGIYDAMNKGISLCSADLIGIINADYWYDDHALESMRELYEKSAFDMAYADIRIYTTKGCFIKRARDLKFTSSSRWNHPSQFVKRTLYEKKKYETDGVFSDLDFLLWLLSEGYRVQHINETLANFSMGGMSNKGRSVKEISDRIEQKWEIYRKYGYGKRYFINICAIEMAKSIFG